MGDPPKEGYCQCLEWVLLPPGSDDPKNGVPGTMQPGVFVSGP